MGLFFSGIPYNFRLLFCASLAKIMNEIGIGDRATQSEAPFMKSGNDRCLLVGREWDAVEKTRNRC